MLQKRAQLISKPGALELAKRLCRTHRLCNNRVCWLRLSCTMGGSNTNANNPATIGNPGGQPIWTCGLISLERPYNVFSPTDSVSSRIHSSQRAALQCRLDVPGLGVIYTSKQMYGKTILPSRLVSSQANHVVA